MGEESVRMTLPMPMKKLVAAVRHQLNARQGAHRYEVRQSIPKCGSRGKHVLPYCPHDAVRAGSEAEDGDGAC